MMNINEIITVFRVECRCIYTGGSKTQTIYEDDMIIINNFETALHYYDYMLKKCDALGYYANHDYWVKIRKCEIMKNGIPNVGDIIIEHFKGDKNYKERRIISKFNSISYTYGIYDTKEEKFLGHIRPFYAFENEWVCWKTINDNTELRNLNYERKEV